jgi:ABC-type amino acid transport substrate-binding protein
LHPALVSGKERVRRILTVALLGVLAVLTAGAAAAQGDPELTVATREVPPFAMRTDTGWDGIAIELWSRVSENLGLRNQYREMGLAEMLAAVESGEADAAVAALTITAEREAKLDFTHPFHTSGLGIAVRQQPSRGWMLIVERVFSERFLRALVPLLALLGTVGVLVWLVERRRNPQFQRDPVRGIGSGLWWSAVTMTTVGYGDKAPLTLPGRLIALVWMFASIIVISSITATIATALTVGELKQTITGLDDLYRARVLTLPGSTSAAYLDGRLVRYRGTKDLPDALDKLEQGEADAVVYDMPILRYLVAERHPQTLQVLPQVLQRQDYGIALPAGSPLREGINRELLEVIRSPQWQELLERYLGKAP